MLQLYCFTTSPFCESESPSPALPLVPIMLFFTNPCTGLTFYSGPTPRSSSSLWSFTMPRLSPQSPISSPIQSPPPPPSPPVSGPSPCFYACRGELSSPHFVNHGATVLASSQHLSTQNSLTYIEHCRSADCTNRKSRLGTMTVSQ